MLRWRRRGCRLIPGRRVSIPRCAVESYCEARISAGVMEILRGLLISALGQVWAVKYRVKMGHKVLIYYIDGNRFILENNALDISRCLAPPSISTSSFPQSSTPSYPCAPSFPYRFLAHTHPVPLIQQKQGLIHLSILRVQICLESMFLSGKF